MSIKKDLIFLAGSQVGRRELDSQYLQRQLELVIEDLDNPAEIAVVEYIVSRLNQSYPDGDVDKEILTQFIKESQIRREVNKIKDLKGFIDYLWL